MKSYGQLLTPRVPVKPMTQPESFKSRRHRGKAFSLRRDSVPGNFLSRQRHEDTKEAFFVGPYSGKLRKNAVSLCLPDSLLRNTWVGHHYSSCWLSIHTDRHIQPVHQEVQQHTIHRQKEQHTNSELVAIIHEGNLHPVLRHKRV